MCVCVCVRARVKQMSFRHNHFIYDPRRVWLLLLACWMLACVNVQMCDCIELMSWSHATFLMPLQVRKRTTTAAIHEVSALCLCCLYSSFLSPTCCGDLSNDSGLLLNCCSCTDTTHCTSLYLCKRATSTTQQLVFLRFCFVFLFWLSSLCTTAASDEFYFSGSRREWDCVLACTSICGGAGARYEDDAEKLKWTQTPQNHTRYGFLHNTSQLVQ